MQLERVAELDAGERAQLERIAELDASISRQALHAVRLSFQHPVLRTELAFEAPLPPDLALLQAKLQREAAAAPAPGCDRNER
ncbi:hypothetical protein [Paenibacillus sonchi]|uniref:hypothetical protein n=1 Tax=Paenibacillus sonchi TaxID=373687 RepID=UPI0002D6D0F3|nr:hypothetical protein [Paenibacillus sonchi]